MQPDYNSLSGYSFNPWQLKWSKAVQVHSAEGGRSWIKLLLIFYTFSPGWNINLVVIFFFIQMPKKTVSGRLIFRTPFPDVNLLINAAFLNVRWWVWRVITIIQIISRYINEVDCVWLLSYCFIMIVYGLKIPSSHLGELQKTPKTYFSAFSMKVWKWKMNNWRHLCQIKFSFFGRADTDNMNRIIKHQLILADEIGCNLLVFHAIRSTNRWRAKK